MIPALIEAGEVKCLEVNYAFFLIKVIGLSLKVACSRELYCDGGGRISLTNFMYRYREIK